MNSFRPISRSGLVFGLILFVATTLRAQTITQVVNNGPRANRINLAIFSEGYTNADLANKFPTDAQALIDRIFMTEPLQEYQSYFNVFLISVASAQSGSDHPAQATFKDTYFNSSYDSSGIDRLLTIPPNSFDGTYENGQGKVEALLMNLLPEFDQALMSVNDPVYGGSGGATAIASTNPSAAEVMIHETGHSFADVGDEYTTPFPSFPLREYPNCTQQTNRNLIVWRNWIDAGTPVPTPPTQAFLNAIGLYEGAEYNATGWYRPKQNCKMNTLNPPFCEICAEAFVLTFLTKVDMIDSAMPTGANVEVPGPTQFSITRLQPMTHSLMVQWALDGAPVNGATMDNFTVDPAGLTNGTHTLTVAVRDPSVMVRTDPMNRRVATRTWTLNVTNGGGTPPARLGNISTRLRVETGDNVPIAGFIVTGTTPKKVIVRALGPSLNVGGVPVAGRVADTTLELIGPGGQIALNDNWRSAQQADISASTVPPPNDLESAIVATLPASATGIAYTAVVRGAGNATGVGQVEVYDLDTAADSQLANISTRGLVQTGDDVMIGGIILVGDAPRRVIVRAIGPSLSVMGTPLPGRLLDTTLEIRDGNGTAEGMNDDWHSDQEAEIIATTVPPTDNLESAIVVTLPASPGGTGHTAIVRGKNGTTGVALVEVFGLN